VIAGTPMSTFARSLKVPYLNNFSHPDALLLIARRFRQTARAKVGVVGK
jgi:hypothetical protein